MASSVSSRSKRWRRTLADAAITAWTAGVPLGFAGVPLARKADQGLLVGTFVVLGALLLVVRLVRSLRDADALANSDSEINDYRIAVKEAFTPIASLLADMPNMTAGKRQTHVDRVADRASSVTAALLLQHIPRVRVAVYALNTANDSLTCISWFGAGDPPGQFRPGHASTIRNVKWVLEGGAPRYVPDVRATPDEEGGRSDAKYGSYIAVVIQSSEYSYGMLTADSSEVDPFTDTDTETVKAVAKLMAVGLASAYPGESRGTSA